MSKIYDFEVLNMQNRADAVIIGGGIIGLAAAYYLTKSNYGHVMLVEKESLFGTGATAKAAGGIRAQFSTKENIEMSMLSEKLFCSFKEDTGYDALFDQVGYMFLIKENIPKIQNSILTFIFHSVENLFSVVLIIIITSSLFLWKEHKREWIPALWAGFIFSGLITTALKFIIARARPFEPHYWPFGQVLDYSFPSLHTAIVFAALPVLDKKFPSIKNYWIAIAVFVALSRLYLGAHYISDVVAGAIIGYCIGMIFVKFEERHKLFKRWVFKR